MLSEEIRSIKSEKKDLRNFGFTIGIALSVLAGLLWWKDKDTYPIFIVLSLAFIFFGLVLPAILRPLQKAWMTLAVILGWFMTRVILSILFYFVFTGIGLGGRLFGKQFLNMKMDNTKKSYWIYRNPPVFNKEKYTKQF